MGLRLLLPALVLGTVLSCTPSGSSGTPAPDAWRAQLAAWKHPAPMPSFPLIDHRGKPLLVTDLAGGPVVVAFVYTRCPIADACPMTMARLKQAQRLAQGTSLKFLVVTLDPEHDTPAVLAEYARRYEVDAPGFTLATGSKEVVDAMTSLFNVIALKRGEHALPDGGVLVEISHPVKLALLDDKLVPQREWFDNNFGPKEIVDASVGE